LSPLAWGIARDSREFLLIENLTIISLYKSLVDGVVSNPGFRENFKTELIRHGIDLSHISPNESGKANEVKYVITPQAVGQLFVNKPQVARKYRE
jgi:hypothetical protein